MRGVIKINRDYYEEDTKEDVWYEEGEGREVVMKVLETHEGLLERLRNFEEYLTIIDMDREKFIERRERETNIDLGRVKLPETYKDENGMIRFRTGRNTQTFQTLSSRVGGDLAVNLREFKENLNEFISFIDRTKYVNDRRVITPNTTDIVKHNVREFEDIVDDAKNNLTTLDDMSKMYYAVLDPNLIRNRIKEDMGDFLIEYVFSQVKEWDIGLNRELIEYTLNVFDGFAFEFGRLKEFREDDEFEDILESTDKVREALNQGDRDFFYNSMKEATDNLNEIKKTISKEIRGESR